MLIDIQTNFFAPNLVPLRKPDCMMYKLIIATLIILSYSCASDNSSNTVIQEQGLFTFLNEGSSDSLDNFTLHIEEEDVLCKGKGLKVGRCISEVLARGTCIGLIKHKKIVYAVEVECDSL